MLRVRDTQTGLVYDAFEFNEATEKRVVNEILGWEGVKEVNRIGNIFQFFHENHLGEKFVSVLAYSDIIVLGPHGGMLFSLPEARFQEKWKFLSFDEILEEVEEFGRQSFTPEGVQTIMTHPQPAFDNRTGREYAEQEGWEALRSFFASWYEGGIV